MNESRHILPTPAESALGVTAVNALDWRSVADKRLVRLVEIEHDHAVISDRLLLLQVDYREVLVASEERLQRIDALQREARKLEGHLADLARQYAGMHAAFVQSHSWRITRPLRALVVLWRADGGRASGIARRLLRVPLIRRAARFAVRRVPGLHVRLRSRLYPQSGDRAGLH